MFLPQIFLITFRLQVCTIEIKKQKKKQTTYNTLI